MDGNPRVKSATLTTSTSVVLSGACPIQCCSPLPYGRYKRVTFLVLFGKLINTYIVWNVFFTLVLNFQGSIKIKVEVWDSDDNRDDHVDFLHSTFRAVPYYNASSAHAISYTLSARTTYESLSFFSQIFSITR